MNQPRIKLWHGGRRWDGPAEIRPVKQGRYEYGPGIYLTNVYETARKYAKGGGVVTLIELIYPLPVLEHVSLDVGDMIAFVRGEAKMRGKDDLIQRLLQRAERAGSNMIPAATLVNLCVNGDALQGPNGPALAQWLASRGIAASVNRARHEEDWVVVFDPAAIASATPVSARDVDVLTADLHLVEDQIAMIRAERERKQKASAGLRI